MRITFLGTGTSQGVPVIACDCEVCLSGNPKDNRLRCSVLIEDGNTSFAIDAGPDFRQQMLRAGVKQLNAVVFTHEHKDHIAGLDDVRAFNYFSKKPMDVYASDIVQQALKREYHYVFDGSNYPGKPELTLHTITNKQFSIGTLSITPVEVLHYKMPVLGFRVGDFCYITDANFISEQERQKIRGCKYLVINALRIEKHISHFNLSEAIEVINDLQPEQAFITHISHQMGLHDTINRQLPPNIALAYDGLIIAI